MELSNKCKIESRTYEQLLIYLPENQEIIEKISYLIMIRLTEADRLKDDFYNHFLSSAYFGRC
jgi:hypothetical protein